MVRSGLLVCDHGRSARCPQNALEYRMCRADMLDDDLVIGGE